MRQIRYAERELESEPVLVVWAELSVTAHLIGEPMPVPGSDLLDALGRFGSRHRECTLSHAVDAAVAARTEPFATRLSPDDLAVHVSDAMNRWVVGNESACTDEGCRRWCITDHSEVTDPRLVLHGVDEPSRLENAVGCQVADPAWSSRLAGLLADFVDLDWPIRRLAVAAGGR